MTGTPPVGFPPPIVVATTVTDANGNYLFEGVQPGSFIVRWDLTDVTTDFRITTAQQGGDDAFDSDSASGDVSGFVYSTEIVVLGGSSNLGVDLGLAETLPAIKVAAIAELTTALGNYLVLNYYTAENWTTLHTIDTDGDTAINAATNPAGVAAAKAAALAAMDAVPTVSETLAEAKVAALADLTTTLDTYLLANYTAENWMTLTTAKANGDTAVNAATDLAGVALAMNTALAAMDAVPTIAETLATAKTAALADFGTVLATYLEANYTADSWTALQTASANGQTAINVATGLAGVTAAMNAALAALDAVPTFAETMATAKAAALSDLTTALATYLEENYYTSENWTAIIAARLAGNTAINEAVNPGGVETAKNAALAAMDAVPTYTETLAAAKTAALADLTTALATYLEANYTAENWTTLNTAKTDGDIAINAATDPAGVTMAKDSALAAMHAVPTIPKTPMFTAISRTAAGKVTLVLKTTPNLLLTLQTSTDLKPDSWITIATATPDTETWTFVHDATLATGPKRFYRAFLNP